MSRSKRNVSTVVVRGPLAAFRSSYVVQLRELGYTPSGVVKQVRLVARLSLWLDQTGLARSDLTGAVLRRFLAANPGLERASAPGLAVLLGVPRGVGADATSTRVPVSSVVDVGLLAAFRHHLLAERGLLTATADRYVDYARRFLAEQVGAVELGTLTSAGVTRSVQVEAGRGAVASTQYFIAGLLTEVAFSRDI